MNWFELRKKYVESISSTIEVDGITYELIDRPPQDNDFNYMRFSNLNSSRHNDVSSKGREAFMTIQVVTSSKNPGMGRRRSELVANEATKIIEAADLSTDDVQYVYETVLDSDGEGSQQWEGSNYVIVKPITFRHLIQSLN